jgi:large subunit ribosomal protein L23
MNADSVIIEPILTEKTNVLREQEARTYVFKVSKLANKTQIMQAVRELFSVHPVSCRVMNMKGKPRSARTKSGFKMGKTRSWKKAFVTLTKGEHIESFEGV